MMIYNIISFICIKYHCQEKHYEITFVNFYFCATLCRNDLPYHYQKYHHQKYIMTAISDFCAALCRWPPLCPLGRVGSIRRSSTPVSTLTCNSSNPELDTRPATDMMATDMLVFS
jgi:hypothetical protein